MQETLQWLERLEEILSSIRQGFTDSAEWSVGININLLRPHIQSCLDKIQPLDQAVEKHVASLNKSNCFKEYAASFRIALGSKQIRSGLLKIQ